MEVKVKTNEMVQVVVRCRPMSVKEKSQGFTNVVKMCFPNVVEIYDYKCAARNSCRRFMFDTVYDWSSKEEDLYNRSVRPLVNSVMCGFNATVFAYGQSSAGKTYTMEGDGHAIGVVSAACDHIFEHISKSFNTQYLVRISFLEIYQDEIRDLLCVNKNCCKYELRESSSSGVYVKNLQSFVCKSVKELKRVISIGRENRAVARTNMNDRSSRSHAVIMLTLEMSEIEGPLRKNLRIGKLNFVDLAGSERQNKTHTSGSRLIEASKINLSLSALGNVVSALTDDKGKFIPYRDSKLTRLLKDSLGGNSMTLMIANISPASCNYNESVNTLRYASRARLIQNKPHINVDPVDALLEKYQDEISNLRAQLAARQALRSGQRSKSVGVVSHCTPSQPKKLASETNLLSSKSSLGNQEIVSNLVKKIELLESKLITGSTTFLEHTDNQKRVLDAIAVEIAEAKQRESEMIELFDLQEESAEEFRDSYLNLQQEVREKFKKLEKMYYKLLSVKEQIRDAREEFNSDRRDLETIQSDLFKEIKLRLTIAENFIPRDARKTIQSALYFNEESESWLVMPACYNTRTLARPKCVDHMRRPVTLYTAIIQRKFNHIFRCDRTQENREKTFRFKGEDILEFELITCPRTTRDYKWCTIPPRLTDNCRMTCQKYGKNDNNSSHTFLLDTFSSGRNRFSTKRNLSNKDHLSSTIPNVKQKEYPKARRLIPK